MKKFIGALVVMSVAAFPLLAQGGRGEPNHGGHGNAPARAEVGNGHIPPHAPARTPARSAPSARPTPTNYAHQVGHPNAPHVDARDNRWVGHDVRRNEIGLRLSTPWQYGHFRGEYGANHIYRLNGGDYRRFGFDGEFFSVAPADYDYAGDWLWNSDDIVLYDDYDHPGFYLAYNVRLGTYVHVQYMGR